MKSVVLAENLQKKISFVSHAISQRSQLPILLNFLLKAEGGFITLSATDLEIGIISKIPAKTEEEGETTVPAKTFLDFVSSLAKEKITLETEGSTLVLTTEKTKAVFPTSDPAEFPKIVDDRGEKKVSIKKEILEREMGRVVFAASSDMGRPALSGVLLRTDDGGTTLVATDGYRLSIKRNFLSTLGKNESLLIPARIIRELLSLDDSEEEVELSVSDKNNQVIFTQGDTTVVGRLIEPEYPDYQKIIPADFSLRTRFDRDEMIRAVKQGSVFAREASNIVRFSIKNDSIIISANAPSVGEDRVEVEAKTQGEENEIAFNAKYLLDFLSSVSDESLVFEMTGPLNPGVFKSEKDEGFSHIIMPIRIPS